MAGCFKMFQNVSMHSPPEFSLSGETTRTAPYLRSQTNPTTNSLRFWFSERWHGLAGNGQYCGKAALSSFARAARRLAQVASPGPFRVRVSESPPRRALLVNCAGIRAGACASAAVPHGEPSAACQFCVLLSNAGRPASCFQERFSRIRYCWALSSVARFARRLALTIAVEASGRKHGEIEEAFLHQEFLSGDVSPSPGVALFIQ